MPRRRLVEVLREVYAIAARHDLLVMNVFHAGDGNLHPLLVFDKREPGVMERVHAAGEEIVRVSVAAGGVLSGEHGIGLEKRDFMPLMFVRRRPRRPGHACGAAFDPDGVANPHKVLPARQPVRRPPARAGGRVDLTAFADEVGAAGPVTCVGGRTPVGRRGRVLAEAAGGARPRPASRQIEPEEMTVSLRGGHAGRPSSQAALAERGPDGGAPDWPGRPWAACWPSGRSGILRLGRGPVRDALLQAGVVTADGDVVKAGGPTVKNVSGFDLCRLLVGSLGTLAFLGDVILRTRPRPAACGVVRAAHGADPFALCGALYRPAAILWDGDDDVGVPRGPSRRRRRPGRAAPSCARSKARRRSRRAGVVAAASATCPA